MFLRLLFVLLIALNIAVGAWLLLGRDDVRRHSIADPGVPVLQLLSEPPQTRASADVAVAPPARSPAAASVPASAPSPVSYRCLSLGPFATPQALNDARVRLGTQGVRMRSRQELTTRSRGWWVYLPAAGSHAQALEQARQLGARHITDYVVVNTGEQPNTVSLGVFNDPDNARKRRDEVAAAGFPARMSERTERVPEYWLDLVLTDGPGLDWPSQLAATGAGSHSTVCF